MAACDMCGNEYDKAFTIITHDGKKYTFDAFECAIHMLAPRCAHCTCMIIGHGSEGGDKFFCCAHCAKQSGVKDVRDRSA